MANIKVKFRKSSIHGKPGTVFYQLSHNSEIKLITTDIHILPEQWNIINNDESNDNDDVFTSVKHHIYKGVEIIRNIITALRGQDREFSVHDIAKFYDSKDSKVFVLVYINNIVANLKTRKQLGTSENFIKLHKSLSSFLEAKDILFSMFDESLVQSYNEWLTVRGLCRNSISFYMRNLRTVYKCAVKMRYLTDCNPFSNVFTGNAKTKKRAIREVDLVRLCKIDVSHSKSLSFAKDMFIFSYCTRGMAYVDIAYLNKSNINNGKIIYYRQKTGQRLVIEILPQISDIINRYSKNDTNYLFHIISSADYTVARRQYQNSLIYYNRLLKQLGEILGNGIQLTSYTPRHTWATTALRHNIPLSVISSGMGHESEKTTQIYLDSIETNIVDEANRRLVDILTL